MPKRMLIDAGHPEETRVVVLDGSKVEEFDFEAATKRPLKGNIYLAKVTRVEPSLQAAFVEYGGNRQGFLAFSEIHPDYYQIPFEDRQALLAEQEAEAKRRQEDDIESFEITSEPKPEMSDEEEEHDEAAESTGEGKQESALNGDAPREELFAQHEDNEAAPDEAPDDHHGEAPQEPEAVHVHDGSGADDADHDEDDAEDHAHHETGFEAHAEAADADHGDEAVTGEEFSADAEAGEGEQTSEGLAEEGAEGQPAQAQQAKRPSQRFLRKKHYKIQEVIKRRQIILVQVVKEERGNKGAALTTYLSLAGRYCVLMPNTPRGGGISRKITNMADRKRLKSAAQALELPEGMGLIIRTAGESKTKLEIRRDYEYLLRLWETIRDTTFKSHAPACVYEEGDLIKRAIRDLYNNNVEEIQVEGAQGYENARDFMAMLMPSHAKNVKLYEEPVPLFQRYHIEAQLDSMFTPTVTLKSGGYIVINQTEALVSIDVNSGRATREHNIEETARKTNLEAADEVGRQLRLRDLAGLIVIDFIDMEDGRNDREVEKRMHNAVKNDRARVQIGKISQFGLLEMSRQRLRAGVVAGSTVACPHCAGQGIVRSVESNALRVLRAVEEEATKRRASHLNVSISAEVAIYILNQKRRELSRIETDYGVTVGFVPTNEPMIGHFEIERVGQRAADVAPRLGAAVSVEAGFGGAPISEELEPEEEVEEEEEEATDEASEETSASAGEEQSESQSREDNGDVRRRRRRRRRGGRGRGDREQGERDERPQQQAQGETTILDPGADSFSTNENGEVFASGEQTDANGEGGEAGRRRRRRRRGRRGRRDGEPVQGQMAEGASEGEAEGDTDGHVAKQDITPAAAPAAPSYSSYDRFGTVDNEIDTTPREDDKRPQPNTESSPVWDLNSEPDTTPVDDDKPAAPPRKGWWQRTFKSED